VETEIAEVKDAARQDEIMNQRNTELRVGMNQQKKTTKRKKPEPQPDVEQQVVLPLAMTPQKRKKPI